MTTNRLVYFWLERELHGVDPAHIIVLEADKAYTIVHLINDTCFQANGNLNAVLNNLPQDLFIRVHRSFAVALPYILKVNKKNVTMGQKDIPVGAQYYEGLVKSLAIVV
ncbi:LytTR family DNA-binding domain-containing protein [Flavihumibacter petaseus]|uniref:Putative LytTR family DNA-binding protein n=1 Tax=Flavihumibacter petaseus NBRC 106054 TaxID=1220578 RepID=A0A0E9N268_9BACT|nr:LytTR family DNA-binding domain-containing protein [Flavihumibacter petaseus]GAO44127.1 putative LytTR family DNA-binding protein [Flavihumibacter petaseus NBRC 106054]